MFKPQLVLSVILLVANASAQTTPQISVGGVVGSGLSYNRVQALSSNALISIFGSNFAPPNTARDVSPSDLVNGLLPASFAGVCVMVGSQPAPLLSVRPTQLNIQLPVLADGLASATVQVKANCGTPAESSSNVVTVPVQPATPEFFSFVYRNEPSPVAGVDALSGAFLGSSGTIPGVTLASALPGEIVALFATGLGLTDPAFNAGELPPTAARVTGAISISIGGIAVSPEDILYAGVAPGFAGLYQINVRVPAGIRGGAQPILLTVDGVAAPFSSISVDGPNPVSSPAITLTPGDGAILSSETPQVQVSFSDQTFGIDTSTFAVTLDGVNITNAFTVSASGATGTPTLTGGQHILAASVRSSAGFIASATARVTVSIFQSLPDASPRSGPIPLTVQFKTTGIYTDGAITRWRWDFDGDGVFDSDDIGPLDYSRTFTKAGAYKSVLEITNDKNQVASASISISAMNQPLTATASVTPSNGGTPLKVTFAGTGSSPNGTIVRYEWDFEGDGVFDYTSTTSGSTTFTYSQAGTYNTVFRVTDSLGQTATAVATTTAVRAGPPGSPTSTITVPSGPFSGNAPLARSFNGTGTASAGRTIVKYEWDFDGDGTYDYSSATTASTTFTYVSPGTFTAALRVTDNTGATGVDTVDITVSVAVKLTMSTDTVRTAQSGTVDVKTTLGGTTAVTIFLKNKGGQTVRTLVSNVTRPAGSYADTWDGKDGSGVPVPDGVYYAALQYKAGSTVTTVDLTNTADTNPIAPSWTSRLSGSGQNCTATYFQCQANPLNNDFFEADFTLPQALELSLDIREISTNLEIIKLFDRVPFGSSMLYNVFWDGTTSSGKAIETPSSDGYLFGLIGYKLPPNGVYVENRPELSNVMATPNYLDPSTTDFISPTNPVTTINYTLSKPATLSLQVFRSGTNSLMRTITLASSTGSGTIAWDGRADNGLFADTGDYHLGLKAVDAAGNQSVVRYVSVRVFY